MHEVKSSVDDLQQSMQQNYLEILTRVRGLENPPVHSSSQDANSITRTDTKWHVGANPDCSGESAAEELSTSNTSRIFSRIFEEDLAVTRVYKRIKWRRSITSIFTTEYPETRSSILSDPNVADIISGLSVYELAITRSEIHKSQQYRDGIERVSNDGPDDGIFSTGAPVTETREAWYTNFPNTRAVESSGQAPGLVLPDPIDALFINMLGIRSSLRKESSSTVTTNLKDLLDEVAFSILYSFDRDRDNLLSATTNQLLEKFLRMFGDHRPSMTGKHGLYIFYDEVVFEQDRQTWIYRLNPEDAPLHLIRKLQCLGREPWLTVLPSVKDLPTGCYTDVPTMDVGHFVDGWLLHHELYDWHVRKPNVCCRRHDSDQTLGIFPEQMGEFGISYGALLSLVKKDTKGIFKGRDSATI